MAKRSRVYAAAIWLLLFSPIMIKAQNLGLSLPSYIGVPQDTALNLPVTVSNFSGVTSMSFAIQWDSAVLSLDTVSHIGNPLNLVDTTHFGWSYIDRGQLRFVRYSGSLPTLNDGTEIFQLRMRVVGELGDSTPVRFTQEINPTGIPPSIYFEVLQNGQALDTNQVGLNHGFVSIKKPVSSLEKKIDVLKSGLEIWPNPSTGAAYARFELTESVDLSLQLLDFTGKILAEKRQKFDSGQHGIEIANTAQYQPGLYFIRLLTSTGTVVQPIVFQ